MCWEAWQTHVPKMIEPNINDDVNTWLKRLINVICNKTGSSNEQEWVDDYSSSSSRREKVEKTKKSGFEKWQKKKLASVFWRMNRIRLEGNQSGLSNYHLFLTKYYKVLLICKDNSKYIIVNMEFKDKNSRRLLGNRQLYLSYICMIQERSLKI